MLQQQAHATGLGLPALAVCRTWKGLGCMSCPQHLKAAAAAATENTACYCSLIVTVTFTQTVVLVRADLPPALLSLMSIADQARRRDALKQQMALAAQHLLADPEKHIGPGTCTAAAIASVPVQWFNTRHCCALTLQWPDVGQVASS